MVERTIKLPTRMQRVGKDLRLGTLVIETNGHYRWLYTEEEARLIRDEYERREAVKARVRGGHDPRP